QAVDVGGADTRVLHGRDARVQRQGRRGHLALISRETRGGGAGERDAVFGGVRGADHVWPAKRNAGNGRPSRSIHVSSTALPISMSSLLASTTVLVKRRPSCSGSSTVTTGCGPAS